VFAKSHTLVCSPASSLFISSWCVFVWKLNTQFHSMGYSFKVPRKQLVENFPIKLYSSNRGLL
jgi:hypothetical protein